jgi:hypothetical protein
MARFGSGANAKPFRFLARGGVSDVSVRPE